MTALMSLRAKRAISLVKAKGTTVMRHKRGQLRNHGAGCKHCKPGKAHSVLTISSDCQSLSDDDLAAAVRAVEADEKLNAEMAEWEAAMIGDGLDEID